MKNWMRVVIGFVVVVVLTLPLRHTIDREGYQRDPSLWALLFPQMEGSYRASIIKSIQAGTVALTGTNTSATTTITAVTAANTYLEFNGMKFPTCLTDASCYADITLTNGTTVTASRNTGANATTPYFTAVELYGNVVKSIQQVSDTTCAGGGNTITAVVLAKSVIIYNGMTTSIGTTVLSTIEWDLASTTNANCSRNDVGDTGRAVVVEYK